MRAFLLSLILLLPPTATQAKGKATPIGTIPVVVEYVKTGREDDATATKLGKAEIDNSNPCVLKMRRDLLALEKRPEIKDAASAISATYDLPKPEPRLVLHFMHEAIELRYEMWTKAIKDVDGSITRPEQLKYRKGVYINDRPNSWQERLDGDQCHVSEEKFMALVDELREADRLASCMQRKRDLLDSSGKVSNYIHNYLPVDWADEARRQLILQNAPVGDLLRADTTVYRSGNSSFHECQRGLKLLEEEASSSVRILNEVRDTRKGTDIPEDEIEHLERLLSGIEKP